MVADRDIIELRQAYEQLQSLELLHEYGPLRAFADPDAALQAQKVIGPAVSVVHETSRKIADHVYSATAPSPWHAYFYLRAQQQLIFRSGQPLNEPVAEGKQVWGEHVFFRGQRSINWEFRTSLRRKSLSDQEVELRAVLALTEYFRSQFAASEDIAGNTARCFAQHYGIATDLMDISCDADTAVWFATHPYEEARLQTEQSVVRSVSWAGQLDHAETLFLLPPPFVRNVYQQRGLFIDASNTAGEMIGRIQMNVRFPAATAGGEFQVIRAGNLLDVWPKMDESEQALVEWARKVATECTSDDAVRTCVRKKVALPDFWLKKELFEFEQQISEWLSILDWVLPATCVTALPTKGSSPMRYVVAGPKVQALVRVNPSLFRALATASEGANLSGQEILRQVIAFAREELKIPH